ncbi:Uncharacterised protein [Halioglobus japonicus]|nr:Uncharacterised protein [Halioglobus japonicus]
MTYRSILFCMATAIASSHSMAQQHPSLEYLRCAENAIKNGAATLAAVQSECSAERSAAAASLPEGDRANSLQSLDEMIAQGLANNS